MNSLVIAGNIGKDATTRPSFDQQRAEAERAAKRLRWQRIAAGGRA